MSKLWAEISTDGDSKKVSRGSGRVITTMVQTHEGRLEVEVWHDGRAEVTWTPLKREVGSERVEDDGNYCWTLARGDINSGEFILNGTDVYKGDHGRVVVNGDIFRPKRHGEEEQEDEDAETGS